MANNWRMMMGARRAALFGVVLAASAVTACTSAGSPASGGSTPASPSSSPVSSAGPAAAVAHPAAAWPTFNRTLSRGGVAPGVRPTGKLAIAWRARLDGAVYGQPLVVGGLVIAATEHDSVYALRTSTGQVAWHATLGTPVPLGSLPCGNIDPLGITGTPAYDRAAGRVYAVAETTGFRHVLFGLSVASGAVTFRRYIPAPDGHQRNDQQRPALAIAHGRAYVEFGGLFGDCGQYRGSVAAVPLTGNGPIASFVVPTAREGAIWGTAGPVFGRGGDFYASAGNGAQTDPGKPFDGSDSVNELTPGLHRARYFAPRGWAADNASDADLGSTQPALTADGSMLIVGKSGTGYLLRAGHLGGIGSQLAQARVCPSFGAAAVSGDVVYEPCRFGSGLAAVKVSAARRQARVLWRGPAAAHGSPVIGGGAVWVTDWPGGTLYALSPATGRVLRQLSLGARLPNMSSLSLAGSHAYLGTMNGVIAVAGA
jgi:polyvinyl alcohol dehydrogenase (cytochrome)